MSGDSFPEPPMTLSAAGRSASSAATRSPVAASQMLAERLPVVGDQLRAVTGAADLHIETLLGRQMRVVRFHRRDHRIHRPALTKIGQTAWLKVGQFCTPITPVSGSFLHADLQVVPKSLLLPECDRSRLGKE